ncbi:hypothetical protein evm_002456 [Chilo suppressalis]|nr:hypothetical protein evm_002456 [Chilo suppressalis]
MTPPHWILSRCQDAKMQLSAVYGKGHTKRGKVLCYSYITELHPAMCKEKIFYAQFRQGIDQMLSGAAVLSAAPAILTLTALPSYGLASQYIQKRPTTHLSRSLILFSCPPIQKRRNTCMGKVRLVLQRFRQARGCSIKSHADTKVSFR